MSRVWWFKTIMIMALVVLSLMLLIPTYMEMWAYPEEVDFESAELGSATDENERYPELPEWYQKYDELLSFKTLSLGLDLKGGLMLRYSVDIDSAIDEKLGRFAADIKSSFAQIGVMSDYRVNRESDRIELQFQNKADADLVDAKFMKDFPVLTVAARGTDTVTLTVRDNYVKETEENSVRQAVEIIRERIDGLGVASPSVRIESGRNIIVELPGLSSKGAAAAEKLISTTAVLTFKLCADDEEAEALFGQFVSKIPAGGRIYAQSNDIRSMDLRDNTGRILESGRETLKRFIDENENMIPSGREVAFEKIDVRSLKNEGADAKEGDPVVWRLRLVRTDIPILTGDNVDDAFPAAKADTNMPYVSLKLDKRGGDTFFEITKAHIGHKLAILMGDVLTSDPVILSEIPGGNVSIEMGRGSRQEALEDVQNLVVSLRSGALPAPIKQEYKTLIGPSLGKDSIDKGMKALAIGFVLVFIFMIVYYKLGGLIASLALTLNLLFVMAGMASIGSALTMPGIAGIILTVGMAVDANVIIFERMREELRNGETVRKSIQLGYDKALWTILDSNITTAIVAVILMQFGSGPVKGFAITLLMGILCSVFTAFYVTRLLFERYASKNNSKLPL